MADIQLDGMSYDYPNGTTALEDLSLSVDDGAFACILGPSGCGKTTSLHILARLATPRRGTVQVGEHVLYRDGRPVDTEGVRSGYLFQDGRLLPWRTVRRNIEIAMEAANIAKERWRGEVARLLALVGMESYEDVWPLHLSGGQRQRVALAKALAIEPEVLLMDEPFGTLDEVTARTLRTELLRIWATTGTTIVFVTHSIREAVYLGDVVHLLTDGPGRLLESVPISLPRPRVYESVQLAEVESHVTELAMGAWGQLRSEENPVH